MPVDGTYLTRPELTYEKKKLLLLLSVALLLVGFFAFDLGQYLSLASFKAQQARIGAYYQAQPLRMIGIYFALYVTVTGLSLPGAAIMTLAAGAIFDLFWGTVIVSFASTIGGTLAFLASRFLLHTPARFPRLTVTKLSPRRYEIVTGP